jgi:hypothetical protein
MASLLPQLLQNGLGFTALGAGFAMLPFALAMLVFPYVGRKLSRRLPSAQMLVLGLLIVAAGNAVTSWGTYLGEAAAVMTGMLILGAGGGLLNGETQKAIMGEMPRQRMGMASGISTTSRFTGILLGFTVLSGILSMTVRRKLELTCTVPGQCDPSRHFADEVVAGNLTHALAGIPGPAREFVITEAHRAYLVGFSTMLALAALCAAFASLLIFRLMNQREQRNADEKSAPGTTKIIQSSAFASTRGEVSFDD